MYSLKEFFFLCVVARLDRYKKRPPEKKCQTPGKRNSFLSHWSCLSKGSQNIKGVANYLCYLQLLGLDLNAFFLKCSFCGNLNCQESFQRKEATNSPP